MKMASPDSATPIYLRAVMPRTLKDRNAQFVKITADMIKTVDYLAISTYPAKDQDKKVITRKDGSVLMNHSVYAGFTDGTFTTLKCDTAIAQVLSVMGDCNIEDEGVVEYTCDEPFDVGFVSIKKTMGKKEYDYWVFNPQ